MSAHRAVFTGMSAKLPFTALDKLIYAIDGISPFSLHFIMRLDGRLDPDHLAGAIEFALEQSPILKAVAKPRAWRPYWRVLNEFDAHSVLAAQNVEKADDPEAEAEQLIERFVNTCLDLTAEPPARFLLIQLPGDRSVFVLKVHHCAMDPAGMGRLLRHIQEGYNRSRDSLEPLQVESVVDRSSFLLWRSVALQRWLQSASAFVTKTSKDLGLGPRRFLKRSANPPSQARAVGHDIAYRSIVLDDKRVRDRAGALGVTSAELILAALVRAVREFSEPGPGYYSIAMGINLTRYAGRRRNTAPVMANPLGAVYLSFPISCTETFAGALEFSRRQNRAVREGHLGLILNLLFPIVHFVPAAWLRSISRAYCRRFPHHVIPTVNLAYLGRIDNMISHFDGCPMRGADGVATAFQPPGVTLFSYSYRGSLTVTLTFLKNVCTDSETALFLDSISREILPEKERHGR